MACGPLSVALWVLLGSVLLVDAISLDLDITKDLENVVKKDNFIISMKHIKPKKRSRAFVETLFSVDFPGSENKFSLQIDRKTKRVIVQTLEDSRYREQNFTVDILHDDTVIKSLILAVNQTEPTPHANLYIDCIAYGMVATPKSMRDMYTSMRRPTLEVFHERKYTMDIDGHRDLRAVLSRNECPLPLEKIVDQGFSDDLFSNSLRDDPNIQAQEPYDSGYSYTGERADIPIVTTMEDVGVISALNQLIKVVNLEMQRCEKQAEAFDNLRRLIEECELCRNRPAPVVYPTCSTNPPGCAPESHCMDTREGPRCAPCPSGYRGDGYTCTRLITCNDRPCFPGANCRDTPSGYECGPCPSGFEGNGRECRRNPCERNPCAPGTICTPLSEDPYYQCSGCPEGMTGNGEDCRDIDECDLIHPCDPNVECINLSPGYRCGACPPGFTGSYGSQGIGLEDARRNRQVCSDIDECADSRICVEHSRCINTMGSYQCGPCEYGFIGNQSVGCHQGEGFCPNGVRCDRNARCVDLGWHKYACQCVTGYAGNGEFCGPDRDLDNWPDNQLPCRESRCKQDNCVETPNSGQEDADGDGIGDVCDPDPDGDGIIHGDNCPYHKNPDQGDSEQNPDRVGDACDNCPYVPNRDQSDIDHDGQGDACDPDIDDDGIPNDRDNCPKKANRDQYDADGDGIGDVCDNCPKIYNPGQEDTNDNLVGDVCDSPDDIDHDGVGDDRDNCKHKPNPDQRDTDRDGKGDECDNDIDEDGVFNNVDNCRYVYNPDQADSDGDGYGDVCQDNYDNDPKNNIFDNCPNNSLIYRTDFSKFQTVVLDPEGESQIDPHWEIYNHGAEIVQTMNSDPGLAVGHDKLDGVDFEGTFFVDTDIDDDYVGFIFSYQNNRRFYTVMWKKNGQGYWQPTPFRAVAEPGIQIKLVDSETGPGTYLRNSLWHSGDTKNQVRLLWIDPRNQGWKERTPYRWFLIHRPKIGLIRLKIFEGERMLVDSGNIFDSTLKGGQLGVLCFSQEQIIWSDLAYRCNDNLREEIWNELPERFKSRVHIDNTVYRNIQDPNPYA
ncbi:cartilage oligomeric matrix protein [Anthonomus grandis grandis]|uniref:cartilage oligomeric matrix protein n=1 Tax=Anthonomus grandis grandis TaxID=2921223 RepID=UPI00216683E2|nr:cartilage oligomeric matrix protein [Anthonomus grandis grandis]